MVLQLYTNPPKRTFHLILETNNYYTMQLRVFFIQMNISCSSISKAGLSVIHIFYYIFHINDIGYTNISVFPHPKIKIFKKLFSKLSKLLGLSKSYYKLSKRYKITDISSNRNTRKQQTNYKLKTINNYPSPFKIYQNRSNRSSLIICQAQADFIKTLQNVINNS